MCLTHFLGLSGKLEFRGEEIESETRFFGNDFPG